MIDLAHKHEGEIRTKMLDTWYNEKYKYYNVAAYRKVYELGEDEGDWNKRQFVSLDSGGKVIGLISYGIDRYANVANDFGAINFSENKAVFGMDVAKVIEDIFLKFNIKKLEFAVAIGNPIEKNYDKLIVKYGGRIVGILKQHYRLIDGKHYDKKIYEIFREDYIKARGSRGKGI